jgi:sugar lactone lactonase YvrE
MKKYHLLFTVIIAACLLGCGKSGSSPSPDTNNNTNNGNGGGSNVTTDAVSTFAGGSGIPYKDGTGPIAGFTAPLFGAFDASGNLYVTDGNAIRKITPAGVVTTFAGNGAFGYVDATGTDARFFNPTGIALDKAGNVYVADSRNYRIRKITPAGVVTTLAGGGIGSDDGTGIAASFGAMGCLTIDASGNLYVTDKFAIRKITQAGVVTTIIGYGGISDVNNVGLTDRLAGVNGIVANADGSFYVTDRSRIRKISATGVISTIAGSADFSLKDGTGVNASFCAPIGITVSASGDIYIADMYNYTIRKITTAGVVTTIAGANPTVPFRNGDVSVAAFRLPWGLVIGPDGNLYIMDCDNQMIRKILKSYL